MKPLTKCIVHIYPAGYLRHHTQNVRFNLPIPMTRIQIFTIVFLFISYASNSQNLFKGKLIDKLTSNGIEDANIVILGTTSGTISKSDGSFELEANKKKITIVISHLSYASLQTEISLKTEFHTIELEKAIYQLERINIRLGEYDGPTELINFDSSEYEIKQKARIKSYSEGEFVIVEDQAEFFGGMNNLKAFIAFKFRYPSLVLSEDLEGTAYAILSITEDGRVEDVEIKIVGGDLNEVVNKEFMRLINSIPIWHPAYQRGKPVSVRLVVPISYAANGHKNKN